MTTAILLAAGVGKRMGPGAGPKCLLSVGGKSLLRRTLESLRSVGVRQGVLVTGFRAEEVEREARTHLDRMRLTVLNNPRYQEGAILSLWTAREFLDRELLVMDADVLCPPVVFERLLGSAHENCLAADGSAQETGEEQMIFGREGRVLHIAKRAPEEIRREMGTYGESLGFLRLSGEASSCLRDLLEQKVQAGAVTIEHEQVYPDLFRKVFVGVERVDGIPWTEIDTPEDLGRAEREVYPRWSGPQCVNRAVAVRFLPWILRLPLSPNQWTFLSLMLGLGAMFFIVEGGRQTGLLAAFLFQLCYLTDNWDGEVARQKGLSSRWGGWFDVAVDGVVHMALPLALALGLRDDGWPDSVLVLGALGTTGVALDFLVTLWAKARGFGPAVFGDVSQGGVAAGGWGFAHWLHQLPPALWADPKDIRLWRMRQVVGWLRVNWTNENFSWVVVLALLLPWRLPLLAAMAVGCQLFWIRFLWRERRRLVPAHG